MTQNYDEWRKGLDRTLGIKGSPAVEQTEIRHAIRAAVSTENLTGDEKWDVFMQLIQGSKEELSTALASKTAEILNPNTFDMTHSKYYIMKYAGMIEALDWVMTLPKTIKENGDAAKKLYTPDSGG